MEKVEFILLATIVLLWSSCCYNAEDPSSSPYHLKPLGSHIPPTKVDEITEDSMITPKKFMEKYMLPRKPLVFRGIVKKWLAFGKWSDDYLRENYPNLELRMEGRKEKRTPIPQGDIALGRDSMKHFISTYHDPDVNKYVVSELPSPLYKYVNIPPPLGCGELRKRFTEMNLWINSGGAQSILHKDSPNTINCVVNGSKEWKLVEFKHNDLIYQAWEGPQEAGYGGHSLINPEKVDLVKFPNILKIPRWYYTHIQAGDCLYLPSQMWHVVHSHGDQNVAVAFLMSQFRSEKIDDLDLEDCGDSVPKTMSLDQIDVDWQYPGFGNMTMGYSDIVDYMPDIYRMFKPKEKTLSKKRIYRFLYQRHEGAAHQHEKAKNRTLALFDIMNKMTPDGKITSSMVKDLTRDQLREIITYIEPHYPAGTVQYEYTNFLPEDLIQLCQSLAEENNGVLTKENYVNAYTEMNGSIKLAEEFWENLTGDQEEVKIDEVVEFFGRATYKYDFYRDEPPTEDEGEDDGDQESEDAIRNRVPESDFYSSPKNMKPDFRDEDSVSTKTLKRKVNKKEENEGNMKPNDKTEL